MKDIVLLGATGYVGRALLNEALERGEKVTAIVRNADKLKDVTDPNLMVVEGDVTDPAVIPLLSKKTVFEKSGFTNNVPAPPTTSRRGTPDSFAP